MDVDQDMFYWHSTRMSFTLSVAEIAGNCGYIINRWMQHMYMIKINNRLHRRKTELLMDNPGKEDIMIISMH